MKNTFVLPFSGSQLTLLGAIFVILIGGLVGCTDFQVGPTETDVAMEGYNLIMELPEAPASPEGPFVIVEQSPTLIGGLDGLQSKIQYPAIAKRAGVEGRVFLQFVVQPDGSVTDAIITRGIGAGCDEEALRMVQNAKFIPGVQTGMRVPVKMSLPVTFKLDENGEPITDPALLKAENPRPPAYNGPEINPQDVIIFDSFEDVDFEYVFVFYVMYGANISDVDAKDWAAKNGAPFIVMGSPKNSAFVGGDLKGKEADPKIRIGIRRK